jgi:hypothetical protein
MIYLVNQPLLLPLHTTQCEEQSVDQRYQEAKEKEEVQEENEEEVAIPLWPNGVSERDVDDLVDEIMKDPNVNMKLLPDAIERRLYKSTIQITFNTFYELLSLLDGLHFLSHQVKIKRVAAVGDDHHKIIANKLVEKAEEVNVKILEEVADKMLQNPAVNLSFVPDVIERAVYSRCMIVIFRVLTVLFSSFKITVCGHDFGLSLEPAVFEAAAINAVSQGGRTTSNGGAVSSLSRIDLDKLRRHAESCGVPDDKDSDGMTEGWTLWDRIWNRQEVWVQQSSSHSRPALHAD